MFSSQGNLLGVRLTLRLIAGHPRLYITPRELPEFRTLSLGPRKRYRTALLKWLEPLPPVGPFEFTHEHGRLTVWPLLPEARYVRAVGGKGFECWVDRAVGAPGGKNYPAPESQLETGAWRIEISPKKERPRDYFLTVLHAGMTRENPARNSIRCETYVKPGAIRLIVNRNSRSIATLCFRTCGRIAVECKYRGKTTSFDAPAPKRVPIRKR